MDYNFLAERLNAEALLAKVTIAVKSAQEAKDKATELVQVISNEKRKADQELKMMRPAFEEVESKLNVRNEYSHISNFYLWDEK